MAMVCPQCKTSFDQRLQCPHCEVRLIYQEGAEQRPPSPLPTPRGWQQTPWGRIFIGLLLAQGMYYGLRHLCVAVLLAIGAADPASLWSTLEGQLLLQGLQVVSLFLGGLFASAGQHHGPFYGTVLGIWNGAFLVLVQPVLFQSDQGQALNTVTLYGQPILQAALGGLAGWLGARIWRPLPAANEPDARRKSPKSVVRSRVRLFAGPIAWTRVMVGTAVAVLGTIWAGTILDLVNRASEFALAPTSALQAQLVTWEITVLAMLAGSALAGASTRNGFKQGLAVGVATAVVLLGIRLASPTPPPLYLLGLSAVGPLILGFGGGGFGSQLLPPLAARPRRKSLEMP
jgi:hypothetical protein